jgi:hypothetical protein
MKFCPKWKLKILLSPFQKVQEHEFLMCGWEIMDWSLSRKFELQSWITFTPFGQIEWGFLLHSPFNMHYSNHASQVMHFHHKIIWFFTWLFGWNFQILK